MKDYPIAVKYLIRIMLVFAVVTVLSITKQLLVPLFFSIFLAYLLFPLARWFEGLGVPRIATNVIVIISFMAVVISLIMLIINLSGGLTNNWDIIKQQFSQNFRGLQLSLETAVGFSVEQQNAFIKTTGLNGDYISTFFEAGKNLLITLALIPVYTFLLLFYRDKFRDFISMMVQEENEGVVQDIIDKAADVVPRYLKGLIVVCVVLVGLNTLGFKLIGVQYPLLFGLVAAIFNLIPYLGTVLGYGLVFLFVFGVQSPAVAGAVAIQFFIIQFTENNILTPNITGSYVRINPLVIIFSIIAGGIIWGLPGMFLVIPTLGILKIVFESVEQWKPYAFLLGVEGTENHSITFKSIRRVFGWAEE